MKLISLWQFLKGLEASGNVQIEGEQRPLASNSDCSSELSFVNEVDVIALSTMNIGTQEM